MINSNQINIFYITDSEMFQSLTDFSNGDGGINPILNTNNASVLEKVDSLTKAGVYFLMGRNNGDMPNDASTYYVLVFVYNSSYKKIFANTVNKSDATVYVRAYTSNSWGDWLTV